MRNERDGGHQSYPEWPKPREGSTYGRFPDGLGNAAGLTLRQPDSGARYQRDSWGVQTQGRRLGANGGALHPASSPFSKNGGHLESQPKSLPTSMRTGTSCRATLPTGPTSAAARARAPWVPAPNETNRLTMRLPNLCISGTGASHQNTDAEGHTDTCRPDEQDVHNILLHALTAGGVRSVPRQLGRSGLLN